MNKATTFGWLVAVVGLVIVVLVGVSSKPASFDPARGVSRAPQWDDKCLGLTAFDIVEEFKKLDTGCILEKRNPIKGENHYVVLLPTMPEIEIGTIGPERNLCGVTYSITSDSKRALDRGSLDPLFRLVKLIGSQEVVWLHEVLRDSVPRNGLMVEPVETWIGNHKMSLLITPKSIVFWLEALWANPEVAASSIDMILLPPMYSSGT